MFQSFVGEEDRRGKAEKILRNVMCDYPKEARESVDQISGAERYLFKKYLLVEHMERIGDEMSGKNWARVDGLL